MSSRPQRGGWEGETSHGVGRVEVRTRGETHLKGRDLGSLSFLDTVIGVGVGERVRVPGTVHTRVVSGAESTRHRCHLRSGRVGGPTIVYRDVPSVCLERRLPDNRTSSVLRVGRLTLNKEKGHVGRGRGYRPPPVERRPTSSN